MLYNIYKKGIYNVSIGEYTMKVHRIYDFHTLVNMKYWNWMVKKLNDGIIVLWACPFSDYNFYSSGLDNILSSLKSMILAIVKCRVEVKCQQW